MVDKKALNLRDLQQRVRNGILDLSEHDLTHLPPEISHLTNLERLYLSNNQLTHLPPEITQLTKLRELNLTSNLLTHLPPEITQLTNLRELHLNDNQLTHLPPEISHLTNLWKLHLYDNRLTHLPPEISHLTDLRELHLSNNQLTHLPPEIRHLTNLWELHLSNNQLTHLPPEISHLANLHGLYLNSNQLTHLPPEITQLTNLYKIHLDDNQLTHLPPEITQLTDIQELYLNDNQLTHLPPEIRHLTYLQELELTNNQLTHLPPEIRHLTNLQELDLHDNQLTHLPPEIAPLLKKGLQIYVENNPLPDPYPEMLARGSNALAAYLLSLTNTAAVRKAKPLRVSEGNVDKNCLVTGLQEEECIEDQPTAHSMEIRPQEYAADAADHIRQAIKALGTKISDCPRFFTIIQENPTWFNPRRLFQQRYQITLWCEHPGHWHPCPDAEYHLYPPRGWIASIAPYLTFVLTTLRVAVSIAGDDAGVVLPEAQVKAASDHIELMKALVEKLPTHVNDDRHDTDSHESTARLTPAQSQALRAFRSILFQEDPTRAFGGLRRVLTPSDEYIWVCPTHYHEYDPGLPTS